MSEPFSRILHARWGDMDFNGHMRNTAYLDAAADVRMMYFASEGFPLAELQRRRMGPVILHDELDYFRELHLLEPVRVTLAAAGASEDLSHFLLVNEFFRGGDELAARVTSRGGWLDLRTRRFAPPPADLAVAVRRMPRSDAFQTIGTLVRPAPAHSGDGVSAAVSPRSKPSKKIQLSCAALVPALLVKVGGEAENA
jgi:acyl-CoA thioester hydrolase